MSFSIVSLGATTQHNASSFTMAAPASTQDADLLIGVLCGNRNGLNNLGAAFPTGWQTLIEVNEAQTTLALGCIVRGASAPSYVGSVGGSGFPAEGYTSKVVAYRATRGPITLDGSAGGYVGAENTYGGSGLALARPGLLFFAAAGLAGFSSFQNETVATTASGATDTTTAPTLDTWIERFDDLAADSTRLFAFADAVPNAAGASGRFRVNTGSAGGTSTQIAMAYAHFVEPAVGRSYGIVIQ